ncbi:MAG TPA: helix-turn-helix domain-containing protein [Mycobacteriales bacterium]|nr:helix-turn-helix domain-containing protein [Mycobacteriales bacterium]
MTRADRSRTDTRERIIEVAFELFSEQGYDKTSLREIAERLGVTKAALYYHFKTKEDIVRSHVQDYLGQIGELVAWGKEQPRTLETRRELITRYAAIVRNGQDSMKFFHQNPQLQHEQIGDESRKQFKALGQLFRDQDRSYADQIRGLMAVFSINASMAFGFISEEKVDPEQVSAAALEVSYELLDSAYRDR